MLNRSQFILTTLMLILGSYSSFAETVDDVDNDNKFTGQGYNGYDNDVEVFDELSASAPRVLSRKRISDVRTSRKADIGLFSDPSRFRHLTRVSLKSDNNSRHLRDLSQNNANLSQLNIVQNAPLSSADLSSIARFKSMQWLSIEAPVENAKLFSQSVPRSLLFLILMRTGLLKNPDLEPLDLPALWKLNIFDEVVTKHGIECLQAPRLKDLNLSHDMLEAGAITSLKKFSMLRMLIVQKTPTDENELAALRQWKTSLKVFR